MILWSIQCTVCVIIMCTNGSDSIRITNNNCYKKDYFSPHEGLNWLQCLAISLASPWRSGLALSEPSVPELLPSFC